MFIKLVKKKSIAICLFLFALIDLRTEIRILLDHFTFTSLAYSVKHHPLAILVLICTPLLFKYDNK